MQECESDEFLFVSSRASAMPRFTNSAFKLLARFSESISFIPALPELSVCPSQLYWLESNNQNLNIIFKFTNVNL